MAPAKTDLTFFVILLKLPYHIHLSFPSRLPKLPLVNSVESAEPLKITKPLNSISKNNDPFAGDKKPPWTSAIPLRSQSKSEVAKSMDELICRHSDAKYAQNIAVLGEKPSGTRLKRLTRWKAEG